MLEVNEDDKETPFLTLNNNPKKKKTHNSKEQFYSFCKELFRRNNKHGVRRVVEQVEERKNEEFREGTRVASRCTAICAIAGG